MIYHIDICAFIIFIFLLIILQTLIFKNYIDNKIGKESFTVSDAEDFHNYDKLKNAVLQKPDNYYNNTLDNPDPSNIVNYNKEIVKNDNSTLVVNNLQTKIKPKNVTDEENKKIYFTDADFGLQLPGNYVSCSNSSIDNNFSSGKFNLLPNQVGCDQPNGLTAENYFKTVYNARSIPIENYKIKGANYMEFSDSPAPYQQIKILSQNTKGLPASENKYHNIPTGSNYGFHNGPVVQLP